MKIRIDELASNGGLELEINNNVTYINNGGMHEENPNEGVLVSVDPEGKPNLVEGKAKDKDNAEGKNTNTVGEVIYDDYVFSDRLFPTEDFRERYKIPKDYTFAKAFRQKSKESEERSLDPISKNTLLELYLEFRENQELVRQNNKMQEAYELFALLTPEQQAYISLAADELVMLPELYQAKYGGKILLADGGRLDTTMMSYDMTGKLLDLTINQIMQYAKQNNNNELLKEAKKAKRGNREDKEDFIDDTFNSLYEPNEYAFGGKVNNKQFLTLLALQVQQMEESEQKKLLANWLMQVSKLLELELDKAIELYITAMQLQLQEEIPERYQDFEDEEDLDYVYSLGGNLFSGLDDNPNGQKIIMSDEEDENPNFNRLSNVTVLGKKNKNILPEVIVKARKKQNWNLPPIDISGTVPIDVTTMSTPRKILNYLLFLKGLGVKEANEEEILRLARENKLNRIVDLMEENKLFSKGGSMSLDTTDSGDEVNGKKVFAGETPWKFDNDINKFEYYNNGAYDKAYLDFINGLDWETLLEYYNTNPSEFSRFLKANPGYKLDKSNFGTYKAWAHDGKYSDWHKIMSNLYKLLLQASAAATSNTGAKEAIDSGLSTPDTANEKLIKKLWGWQNDIKEATDIIDLDIIGNGYTKVGDIVEGPNGERILYYRPKRTIKHKLAELDEDGNTVWVDAPLDFNENETSYAFDREVSDDATGETIKYWNLPNKLVPYPKAPIWPFLAAIGLQGAGLINNLRKPDYLYSRALASAANRVSNPRLIASRPTGIMVSRNPYDIDYVNNTARSAYLQNSGNIRNLSNGNIGMGLNQLLQNAFNYYTGIGENYRKMYDYNAADDRLVAGFNRDTLQGDNKMELAAAEANLKAQTEADRLYYNGMRDSMAAALSEDTNRANAISSNLSGIANMLYNIGVTNFGNRLALAYSENGNTGKAGINPYKNHTAAGGRIKKRKYITGKGSSYAPYNINTLKPTKGLI